MRLTVFSDRKKLFFLLTFFVILLIPGWAQQTTGNVRGFNQRFAELWDLPEHLLTRRDDTAVFAWMSTCVLDADRYVERLAVIARSPLIESTDVLMLKTGKVLERVTLPQYARSRADATCAALTAPMKPAGANA